MQRNKNTENELDILVKDKDIEFEDTSSNAVLTEEVQNSSKLIYETENTILPGQKMTVQEDKVIIDKDKANEYLVNTVVEMNNRNAREELANMSDDEKIKNYVYEMEYYSNTNKFFRENGYEMSGKQKRQLRRNIDIAWRKGKIKLTQKQRDDILFEVGKMSTQTKSGEQNKFENGQSTGAKQIASMFNRL